MELARRVAVSVAMVALAVAGCTVPTTQVPATNVPAPRSIAQARQELGTLSVAPARGSGYQRTDDFGSAWVLDADHNGCRQRDDVLRRDLVAPQTRGRCIVVAGTLHDPYTGRTVPFAKARADEVQVDHVYPLGLAWRHGAASWPQQRRVQFANDLANLLATSAAANQKKSDHGPGEWMPRRQYWCAYAVRYIGVADRYALSISAADRSALTSALGTCPAASAG
jgi:hypothetical protein